MGPQAEAKKSSKTYLSPQLGPNVNIIKRPEGSKRELKTSRKVIASNKIPRAFREQYKSTAITRCKVDENQINAVKGLPDRSSLLSLVCALRVVSVRPSPLVTLCRILTVMTQLVSIWIAKDVVVLPVGGIL